MSVGKKITIISGAAFACMVGIGTASFHDALSETSTIRKVSCKSSGESEHLKMTEASAIDDTECLFITCGGFL